MMNTTLVLDTTCIPRTLIIERCIFKYALIGQLRPSVRDRTFRIMLAIQFSNLRLDEVA